MIFREPFEGYNKGACRGSGVSFLTKVATQEQKSICNRCPVFKQCETYALHNEIWNVWAGMGAVKRTNLRKKLGIAAPDIMPMAEERRAS